MTSLSTDYCIGNQGTATAPTKDPRLIARKRNNTDPRREESKPFRARTNDVTQSESSQRNDLRTTGQKKCRTRMTNKFGENENSAIWIDDESEEEPDIASRKDQTEVDHDSVTSQVERGVSASDEEEEFNGFSDEVPARRGNKRALIVFDEEDEEITPDKDPKALPLVVCIRN
jgi:hypothetical protein